MSSVNPNNPFASFVLAEDEVFQGTILNAYQKMAIQNLIATHAVDYVNLDLTDSDINVRIQAAHLKGKMEALQELLNVAKEAEHRLLSLNQQNAAELQETSGNFYGSFNSSQGN